MYSLIRKESWKCWKTQFKGINYLLEFKDKNSMQNFVQYAKDIDREPMDIPGVISAIEERNVPLSEDDVIIPLKRKYRIRGQKIRPKLKRNSIGAEWIVKESKTLDKPLDKAITILLGDIGGINHVEIGNLIPKKRTDVYSRIENEIKKLKEKLEELNK